MVNHYRDVVNNKKNQKTEKDILRIIDDLLYGITTAKLVKQADNLQNIDN
ncbi:MAG: hypothetical protein WC155_00415 [Candidatus Cloacimonadales bacterium]